MTATALFFVPVLVLLLGAGQLAAGGVSRRAWKLLLGYALAPIWLAGIGAYLWFGAMEAALTAAFKRVQG